MQKPLHERPLDLVLVAAFLSFAITSFLFDPYTALDVDLAASTHAPARVVHWFGVNVDPLVLHPPLFLRIMVGVSVLVFGPIYLVLAYGIWREREWIRTPGIAYAAIKIYSMIVYLGVALFGETRPRDLGMFAATYLPYLLVPILLLLRLRRSTSAKSSAHGLPRAA
jgi:hypothetical protein